MKIPKTVNINGLKYKIILNKQAKGGMFDTKKQTIELNPNDVEDYKKEVLLHEIMEALLCEKRLRYESADGDIKYIMTHRELEGYITTLLQSIDYKIR